MAAACDWGEAVAPDEGELAGLENHATNRRWKAAGPGTVHDHLGNGKLAIRAGAGMFHGVTGIAYSGWYLGARPPLTQNATITNGTADNPASGVPNTTRFPIDAGSLPTDYKIPVVYNYSFGVQTLLPGNTQLDISYVGNSGRHMSFSRPLNFLTPPEQAAHQGVDLRPFLPYRGLGGLNLVEPSATSSYNSLQTTVRRRKGALTYSLSYTFGKIVGFGNEGVAGGIQDPLNVRAERSELEESRRHYAVVMHTYELPWFKTQQGLFGRVLGGWSFTGVWTVNTGRLYGPSLTAVARQVATRPDVVGDWYLPAEQRTIFRYFNPAAFARPADPDRGRASNDKILLRRPVQDANVDAISHGRLSHCAGGRRSDRHSITRMVHNPARRAKGEPLEAFTQP